MLTEFKTMWDGIFGKINVTKRHLKFFEDEARSVVSAQNCAGVKTMLLERVGIDRIHAHNVIEPAQNEWAAA